MWAILPMLAGAQESIVIAQTVIERQLNGAISSSELEKAAIIGMVQRLEQETGLQGSTVQTKLEFAKEKAWREGKREGYGLRVQLIPQRGFLVDSVIKDSPAFLSGIQKKDVITAFANQSLIGLPPQAMLNILNQEYEGKVPVELQRNGSVTQVFVEKGNFSMEMISHNGAISLHFFGKGVCQELAGIISQNPDADLILDVRDNEGGLWEEGFYCLDLFLDENTVLGYRQMVDDTAIPILSKRNAVHTGNIVVLVNQGTRGPAELFSLVLQEYGRAELVGEQTAGFAADYQFYPINEEWMIKIADTEMLSAKKKSWKYRGVTPNVSVGLHLDRPSYTPLPQMDLQLETAYRMISHDSSE